MTVDCASAVQRCHNWLHTLHTVGMMKILLKLHRLLQKFYFELLAKGIQKNHCCELKSDKQRLANLIVVEEHLAW